MRLCKRPITALLALAALSALSVLSAPSARAEDLNVAVAANFFGTLQRLAPKFEQASGNKLLLSSGSSGQFYTQIREGAPFDVLLSADSDRPKQLEAEGLGLAGSRFTFAIGTLVLWSPKPGVVDRDGKVLRAGAYRMIGIAEPRNAPYGAAAQQVLSALGLWDQLNQDKKLAVGENINQAWQFAATGNVDMAFVALSQVSDDNVISGSYWLPPQALYTPLTQDAVILTRTSKRAVAEAFLKWLRQDPQAIATIKAAGYHVPE
ncbi:MAG TPA: molybdate ABC transporter substrate-binding protein [Steroidobacteraceae bacterium]|jgi:molybdate transport system substrate-binding protein|nr:molybdate ABC transporter substrate-binding protein [Steroidobacteraceae bacterium]